MADALRRVVSLVKQPSRRSEVWTSCTTPPDNFATTEPIKSLYAHAVKGRMEFCEGSPSLQVPNLHQAVLRSATPPPRETTHNTKRARVPG